MEAVNVATLNFSSPRRAVENLQTRAEPMSFGRGFLNGVTFRRVHGHHFVSWQKRCRPATSCLLTFSLGWESGSGKKIWCAIAIS
jgi:hypothetical protein